MKIIINGDALTTTAKTLTYEAIAALVEQIEPTIVYTRLNGAHGSVMPGSTIELSEGMVISALNTGNA